MWAQRIDPEFRSRAPRLVRDPAGGDGEVLVCENLMPSGGAAYFAAGVRPDDLPEVMARGWEAAPEHVRDPAARLAAQDEDRVRAEVLYASYGMQLFHLDDASLRRACFRAFNSWAAEYCAQAPDRLIGTALIDLEDVPEAVAELERAAKAGLRGAMIWAEPPLDRPYSHPDYAAFFAASQDLDMKLSLHALTSKRPASDPGEGDILYRSVVLYQEIGRTLSDLILHGVLERFPRLQIISAENEIGWMPFHTWRMDQLYEKLYAISDVKLPMKPSEYLRRQCHATFIEDRLLAQTGIDAAAANIMWSSDFPHLASSWPRSHEFIDASLGDIDGPDRRAIVHDNVARLYRLTTAGTDGVDATSEVARA